MLAAHKWPPTTSAKKALQFHKMQSAARPRSDLLVLVLNGGCFGPTGDEISQSHLMLQLHKLKVMQSIKWYIGFLSFTCITLWLTGSEHTVNMHESAAMSGGPKLQGPVREKVKGKNEGRDQNADFKDGSTFANV